MESFAVHAFEPPDGEVGHATCPACEPFTFRCGSSVVQLRFEIFDQLAQPAAARRDGLELGTRDRQLMRANAGGDAQGTQLVARMVALVRASA
jgi:hypothetical protein